MPIISNFPMGGNTDEIEQLIGEHNKSAEAHKEQFDKQKEYTDAARTITRTVTLTAAGWTDKAQTVTCEGVAADEAKQQIIVMPASKDESVWGAAAVRCVSQGENSLNFTCSTVPTEDISVYVNITQTAYQLDVTWDTSKEYPFGDITPAEMRAKIEAASADDLSTHVTDKNNPHGVTAEQIGAAKAEDLKSYLPLTGGAMTGPITRLDSGTGIRPIVLTGHNERDDGVTVDRGFCAISSDPAMYTMASDGSASAVKVSQNDVQIVRSKKGATTGISVNFEQIEIGGSSSSRTVIRNVTTPSEDSDAVPKSYVDAHSSDKNNPHGVTAAQIGALKSYTQMIAEPETFDAVKALEPGVYGWVSSTRREWMPDGVRNTEGAIRFELIVRRATSDQNYSHIFRCIDGALNLRMYTGEFGYKDGVANALFRWAEVVTTNNIGDQCVLRARYNYDDEVSANPTIFMLRGYALYNTETTPTYGGIVSWQYG